MRNNGRWRIIGRTGRLRGRKTRYEMEAEEQGTEESGKWRTKY